MGEVQQSIAVQTDTSVLPAAGSVELFCFAASALGCELDFRAALSLARLQAVKLQVMEDIPLHADLVELPLAALPDFLDIETVECGMCLATLERAIYSSYDEHPSDGVPVPAPEVYDILSNIMIVASALARFRDAYAFAHSFTDNFDMAAIETFTQAKSPPTSGKASAASRKSLA